MVFTAAHTIRGQDPHEKACTDLDLDGRTKTYKKVTIKSSILEHRDLDTNHDTCLILYSECVGSVTFV